MQTTPEAKAISLFSNGASRCAYRLLGCHRLDPDTCRFAVWAPRAEAVSLVGDFNGWQPGLHPLRPGAGGLWQGELEGLSRGQLYKYAVTGADGRTVLKADPFAFHAETGPATASKVWPPEDFLYDYPWEDGDYLARRAQSQPRRSPLSIYELHVGSWRLGEGEVYPNYRRLAPQLAAYCREMGFTHVELLPLCEYPFGESWGYQCTGYFAPTSRYGTPQDLMYLIDYLHRQDIGVLLDWAPAHFPRDEHGLARFDGAALFEPEDEARASHPQWGTLIFDYGRPQVVSFLISSALFWLKEYHIDGLRVDAVSSMLYLNYGREQAIFHNREGGEIDLEAIELLRRLNLAVEETCPGCVTVAEESTAYPLVTGRADRGGLGFSFKWDMGLMHDSLDYLALDPLFRCYHQEKLSFSLVYAFSEHFVNAFSHDEVVHGKKSLLDKMFGPYEQKFANLRALFGWQYGHPGKKLNFMGSEFGQFIEWDHHRQLDWFLLQYPAHDSLHQWVRALNHFYLEQPALWRADDSWQGFAWLSVDDREKGAVAFLRRSDRREDQQVVCLCAFTPMPGRLIVGLPGPGYLKQVLSSEEPRFGGSGAGDAGLVPAHKQAHAGHPYSAELTLPLIGAAFYIFTPADSAAPRGAEEPGRERPLLSREVKQNGGVKIGS